MAYFQTKGVAIVTGSASGIGKGAAYALAAAGATAIAFADINEINVKAAAEESKKYATHSGYKAQAFKVNVTDAKAVEGFVETVVRTFGSIDYLVNAAGVDIAHYALAPDIDIEDYERVMATNAKGILLVSNAVVKVMAKQESRRFTTVSGQERMLGPGTIVNVTSAASIAGVPTKLAYVASKHAALGIAKAMALDVAPLGIRINCVCPSWVNTPMFEEENRRVPIIPTLVKRLLPIERAADVDEVGNSIVYLCSPAASYVNGHALVLDSGLTTGPSLNSLAA